jgi:hypothetical protein
MTISLKSRSIPGPPMPWKVQGPVVSVVHEPFAIFLTVFGLGGLPIALGFLLATRGARPQPWVAPWRAGYWLFALGFLTVPFAVQEANQRILLPIGHTLFLLGAALNSLGWLRLWRGPVTLALAAFPMGLYGVLYLTWGMGGGRLRWATLFSSLFALTSAVAAIGAHHGLKTIHSHLRLAATLLLALHALFWTARALHAFAGYPGVDFLTSLSFAAVEGTLFLGGLAYLQWSIVMD